MEYFISDLHFDHKNILKFERVEFKTIEDHNEFIVASINSVVTKLDTLYILGDIGDDLGLIKRINGRKILIMGNHDRKSKDLYKEYFDEVYNHPLYINRRVILSHIPVPVTSGTLNVHGHLHGSYLDSNNHFNVSAMLINYRPVSSKVIDIKMSKLEKESVKFLEEWYAHMYVFMQNRTDVVYDENGLIKLEESIKLRDSLKHDSLGYVIDCVEEKK